MILNKKVHFSFLTAFAMLLFFTDCSSTHGQSSAEEQAMREDSLAHARSGPPVTVDGTARNAKAGAVVVTDKAEVYYIDGRQAWEPMVEEGKRMSVSGELVETDYMEEEVQDSDSLAKNGTLKKQKLIIKARYSLVQGGTPAP
jgi:hypothetical protein